MANDIELRHGQDVSNDNSRAARCLIWAEVLEAQGLVTSLHNGHNSNLSSYATLELVDASTGKVLKSNQAKSHRTKSVVKSRQPQWSDGATVWENLPFAAARLALRVNMRMRVYSLRSL